MLVHEELGIHQVRLPLPFTMNHVNGFAVKGSDGWSLIDAGLNLEDCRNCWLQFFSEQAIAPSDIKSIYVTHFHPDHYGGAGWLQNYAKGAPVYMGKIEAGLVVRFWQTKPGPGEMLHIFFKENGMPEEVRSKVMEAFAEVVTGTAPPHPELTIMDAEGKARLGDYEYRVMLVAGHSDGHVCLYNEEYKLLFAGDNLLPKINISLWPQQLAAADPLNSFFHSLNWLRTLDCRLIISGHDKPFESIEERVSAIEGHHRQRLALIKSLAVGGTTAYEICRQVFRQDIGAFELRFAMAETLAHLAYLTFRNELEKSVRGDGVVVYSRRA